jgi:hypothetical protein
MFTGPNMILDPKWRLRYEYWSGSNVKEYAVRYRIHEFLSGEYVYSTDKSYFRIVGNCKRGFQFVRQFDWKNL